MGNDTSFPKEIRDQIKEENPSLQMRSQLIRLYRIAKEVNTFECNTDKKNIVFPRGLSYANQHQNACMLRSSFSSFQETPEGLFLGDSTIRKVFSNFSPLTTSQDSSFGIVATTGLQKAETKDPFMVVKYYFDTDPIPFLFEIVVGMILNDARRIIPNVMFTYGGLYCSAPVNARRTYRQILENNIDDYKDKLFELMESRFQSFQYVKLDKEIYDRFEQICLRFVKQEDIESRLLNITNFTENVCHKIEKAFSSLGYSLQKSPFYAIEHRPRDTEIDEEDRISRDEEECWIRVLNKLRYKNNTFSRDLYNQVMKMKDDLSLKLKKVNDFNPQLMCDPNRALSVILFMEKIPDSKRLEEYLKNYKEVSFPDVSEIINIWSQLVFTIQFLWKNYQCSHNDLHPRNILIRQLNTPIDIVYPLGELMSLRVNCIATLIDFGLSTLVYEQELIGYNEDHLRQSQNESEVKDRHLSDLGNLHYMFREYYENIQERFSNVSVMNQVTLKRLKSLVDLESLMKGDHLHGRPKDGSPFRESRRDQGDSDKYIQSFYSIVKEFNE